jgi:CTP:molybdopterin cytidylyltransferase MocA
MTGERATVILPCAGAGRRLGLPFGKELLPLGPGSTPLDATLALLLPDAARLRLVVVLGPEREATARHILRTTASSRLPVAFTSQQPGLAESTGAVMSAAPWYSERNLVLLPDQVLTSPPGGLVTSALDALTDAPFCFLASRETDPFRISRDGALAIAGSTPARLLAYAEHPAPAQAGRFNAVWFGFGFRRDHAQEAVSLLHRAVTGEGVTADEVAGSPLGGCAVIDTGPYRDLGTWPAVMAHWAGNTATREDLSP